MELCHMTNQDSPNGLVSKSKIQMQLIDHFLEVQTVFKLLISVVMVQNPGIYMM